MTKYIHRAFLIVNNARRKGQRKRWKRLGPAGEAEARTFTAPLSADGSLPATHFGASSAFTAAMRETLSSGNDLGLTYYVIDEQAVLRFTNSKTTREGSAFTWEDALVDMGLQPAGPVGP